MRTWIVGLLLLACACSPLFGTTAIAFNPPAQYAAWFARTEECSGLRGRLDRIHWYVVPGVDSVQSRNQPRAWAGLAVREGKRYSIILAGKYQFHEMIVQHEMLHVLLWIAGGPASHPPEYFEQRCKLTWESSHLRV